jgi:hypothetical protein
MEGTVHCYVLFVVANVALSLAEAGRASGSAYHVAMDEYGWG